MNAFMNQLPDELLLAFILVAIIVFVILMRPPNLKP